EDSVAIKNARMRKIQIRRAKRFSAGRDDDVFRGDVLAFRAAILDRKRVCIDKGRTSANELHVVAVIKPLTHGYLPFYDGCRALAKLGKREIQRYPRLAEQRIVVCGSHHIDCIPQRLTG